MLNPVPVSLVPGRPYTAATSVLTLSTQSAYAQPESTSLKPALVPTPTTVASQHLSCAFAATMTIVRLF